MQNPQLKYTGAALPGAGATIILFQTPDTGVRNFLALASAGRFQIVLQNDQALTLRAYWSDDFGVTWNQYNSQSVAIPAASTSSGPYDYDISAFRDWKIDMLNGGSNQTTFRINMSLIDGLRQPGV
jgi:hypothetical protein